MPKFLIEVSDAELALFRKAMDPAVDSRFGVADLQPYGTAQAEIVARIVTAADEMADRANIGRIARECIQAADRYEDGSPKKIHAIKLYRERTGADLKESKDAVEAAATLLRLAASR